MKYKLLEVLLAAPAIAILGYYAGVLLVNVVVVGVIPYLVKYLVTTNPLTHLPMEKTQEVTDTEQVTTSKLVLYNDDVNSIDYVILVLMRVLGHTMEQAEQLTIIIHHKGKATIKEGEASKLLLPYTQLIANQLNAEIV